MRDWFLRKGICKKGANAINNNTVYLLQRTDGSMRQETAVRRIWPWSEITVHLELYPG